MLRRSFCALVGSIPRSAWDPAHHNGNWVDSYSTSIADRRHWPAKKWSIGLEPRTPREWLKFSYRNLAYAYNGALRACTTFPEMLVYYREMKLRGVKVDVDTLNVLLSRAARYEHIQVDDVFLLFDELTALGARPDIAAVETLHTVLEHAAQQPPEWREARRRQLVELYQYLALEEIERLAPHHADALLATQIARLRGNLKQLHASLSPSVYRRYLAVLDSGEMLIQEVHNFLWEYVGADHAALDVPSLGLRIPFVASVMKRPAASVDPSTVTATDFEDADVCSVLLAAVERCVDGDLHDRRPVSERRMYLALLTMLTSSGVLYSADIIAQLMDMVKYSRDERGRDRDAQRLLRYALRGSSAANDAAYRELWRAVASPVDARVIGRYLASRDPWSPLHICYDRSLQFRAFPALQPTAKSASTTATQRTDVCAEDASGGAAPNAADGAEGVSADMLPSIIPEPLSSSSSSSNGATNNGGSEAPSNAVTTRTAESLQQRWSDVQRLIDVTGVLKRTLKQPRAASSATDTKAVITAAAATAGETVTQAAAQEAMEVFTGCAAFLRGVASGARYGPMEEAMSIQAVGEDSTPGPRGRGAPLQLFAGDLDFDAWQRVLQCVQQLRQDMEAFMAQHYEVHGWQIEPEFECWEAMLVVLRCVLDFCVVHTQQYGRAAGGGMAEALFQESAQLRAELVEESRTRFNGRMRILWLQEV